jgi:CO/xanthine dehydrogenase Mo-binding subunit/aerobic-type carbon monoxide dehydrogenase small subunit (CoxS/CutS family)
VCYAPPTMTSIVVNGQLQQIDEQTNERLIDALRSGLRLTGAKESCSSGACGACTVLADGVPVVSCLLPTTAAGGRRIDTVEGLGPALHPVQRALMAHDGLQCGFCTPGMVMQGVAFYRRWRAARGVTAPTRDEVNEAMSGHLCRCGAYVGIIAAITRACAGHFDGDTDPPSPRHDARHKVTGAAKYTVDVYPDGVLEGAILRSLHAHARVHAIDLAPATAAPGVRAVVSMLGERSGPWEVRYVGQEIAAVAAVSAQAARAALALIDIEYEVLPAAIGMDGARAEGAPRVYTLGGPRAPSESELPLVPGPYHHNQHGPFFFFSHHPFRAAAALEAARLTRNPGLHECTWRTQGQCHTPLEPHAAVAEWTGNAALTVYLSTQACADMASDIAERYALPSGAVTVLAPHVGGAFGSKSDLTPEAIAAIDLARQAGAPVRVVLQRPEEFTVGGYRPGVEVRSAVLGDATGRIHAISMHAYADGGVAIGSTVAGLCRFPLAAVDKVLLDYDVVSHGAPAKPFRGPGGPAACWALERSIASLCDQLGVDWSLLRKNNTGYPAHARLFDWVERLDVWRNRAQHRLSTGAIRRGIGLSFGAWGYFVQPQCEVEVSSAANGLTVASATQDLGTGTRTVLAQAAAGVFGLDPAAIHVHVGHSTLVRGPVSNGSRTMTSARPAAIAASQQLRDRLVTWARESLGLDDVRADVGGLVHAGGRMPWGDVFAQAPPQSARARRKADRRPFLLPFALNQFEVGRGIPASIHVVEAEVHVPTGHVRVPRLWAAFSVGDIAVPVLATSQAYGGAIQGVGYALYEERVIDPNTGAPLTLSLDDYMLPGIGDVPEMQVEFLEGGFEYVEGGGVGIGEITTIGVSAAVGNAVAHATGWQPTELPLRPDRVLRALAAGAES